MPKLKVYRTSIGFHDAYVAAPSQKAALSAWGSDANLFARGEAELVEDAALAEEPLAHPGKVIKRLRGSAAEHLAALPPDRPKPRGRQTKEKAAAGKTAQATPPSAPRPSRAALDAAEQDLEQAVHRRDAEARDFQRRQAELDRERRDAEKAGNNEIEALTRAVDRAQDTYDRAIKAWRG